MAPEPALTSISAVLEGNVAMYPDRLAVAGPRDGLTWRQLKTRSDTITAALHDCGVARVGRVCLYLPSSPVWVAAFLALRRQGLTGVSIGNRARPAELRDLLSRFGVRLVVTEGPAPADIAAVCKVAGVDMLDVGSAPASPPFESLRTRGLEDAALIHLTSGSSGTPKGVVRSEADLLEEARNVASALDLGADDRVLSATPVYHSFASGLLMACLLTATPCLLMDRLAPATLLDFAHREAATIVTGVPYVFQTLTALASSRNTWSSLRLGVSGGAPLRADTARRFLERFGAPLVQEYGLSEAGIVSLNLAYPERSESAGAPIPNVSLRIVDPADASRELPTGAVGEVLVRRTFPPTAYLDHPEESRATFTPYGVRSGDLGCIDAEGLLTLTGRIKSMINVAGAKVAPREVEDTLLCHPAVEEAVVFGVPSPELGEAVAAVVVLRQYALTTESALIAHCREGLSAYKVPATVHVLPELPRTLSGKADVPRIRELVSCDAGQATGRQS